LNHEERTADGDRCISSQLLTGLGGKPDIVAALTVIIDGQGPPQ
jgi:hypothetical protein